MDEADNGSPWYGTPMRAGPHLPAMPVVPKAPARPCQADSDGRVGH